MIGASKKDENPEDLTLDTSFFYAIIREYTKGKMSIKLAILKSGETVISDAKELISDDKVCGYLFTNPEVVSIVSPIFLIEEQEQQTNQIEISLSPWIVLSKDKQIPVPPDWIVTIVEPIETVKEMYEEKLNGQSSKVSSIED
jgi:hypothetical protein